MCVSDLSHCLSYEEWTFEPDHTFREEPIKILNKRTKLLQNKEIPLFLIQWSQRSAEEAMWEVASCMKESYRDVFDELVKDYEDLRSVKFPISFGVVKT